MNKKKKMIEALFRGLRNLLFKLMIFNYFVVNELGLVLLRIRLMYIYRKKKNNLTMHEF